MQVTQYNDYRSYLMDIMAERKELNGETYSLRKFASDLDISPASMSHIFQKKKGLSLTMARKIASSLVLNDHETDYFCDLVQFEHARSEKSRQEAKQRLDRINPYRDLTQFKVKEYKSLSKWYYTAIVELSSLEGFKSEPQWISRKFGIDKMTAERAVQHLVELGMLSLEEGRLSKPTKHTVTGHDLPMEAIRQFHREMMVKASSSIEGQKVAVREISTIVLTVCKEQLPELKKRLRALRREFVESAEENQGDQLYCLTSQFFRLDQDLKEELH